ncbi:MAG: hypothetical protein KDC98_11515, partial [Planctomycetes bacterium]|nr:hypothetical protein [Planctomycetota bacterium]
MHLIGPGQVGRQFLRQLDASRLLLLAVTDSTATAYARTGLDAAAIAAHKERGEPLRDLAGTETIPTATAIELVAGDIVVDTTPSHHAQADRAIERARAALRVGARLALAGKNALAIAAPELLLEHNRGRVGIQAALGGAGRQLV